MVRLLFFFKASASALPGWAGRPHECKQGSQEHGHLDTIGTDAIRVQVHRCEAAVLLQSLCQCLAGLDRKATRMQAKVSRARSLGTIITHRVVAEVNRGEAAVLLQSRRQCLAGLGR